MLGFKNLHFPVILVPKNVCFLRPEKFLLSLFVLCLAWVVPFGSDISPVYTSLAKPLPWWWWQRRERERLLWSEWRWSEVNLCQSIACDSKTISSLYIEYKIFFSLYVSLAFQKRACPVWTLLGEIFFFLCINIWAFVAF